MHLKLLQNCKAISQFHREEMAWGNHLIFYAWNIKIKYQMGKWIPLYRGWERHRKGFVVEGKLNGEPERGLQTLDRDLKCCLRYLKAAQAWQEALPRLSALCLSRDIHSAVLITRENRVYGLLEIAPWDLGGLIVSAIGKWWGWRGVASVSLFTSSLCYPFVFLMSSGYSNKPSQSSKLCWELQEVHCFPIVAFLKVTICLDVSRIGTFSGKATLNPNGS